MIDFFSHPCRIRYGTGRYVYFANAGHVDKWVRIFRHTRGLEDYVEERWNGHGWLLVTAQVAA